jgi:ferredoxin
VNRIVEVLMGNTAPGATVEMLLANGDAGEARSDGATIALPKPSGTAKEPELPAAANEPKLAPSDRPYIDSELCTSCNDCLKINPLLFVYNANNQAEIGDPLKGTFVELVKAAEKCPARCIHPGSPRADDKTATSAIISRALKF